MDVLGRFFKAFAIFLLTLFVVIFFISLLSAIGIRDHEITEEELAWILLVDD